MRHISLFNRLVNLEWILLLAIVVVGVFLYKALEGYMRALRCWKEEEHSRLAFFDSLKKR